jgi:hypothetical protein
MRARRALLLALVAVLIVGSGRANAEPPFFGSCGVVRAFTAPTAGAAGSITIGSQTLAVTASDQVVAPVVGTVVCTRRGVLTSGPITVIAPMPVPLCGRVESINTTDGGVTVLLLQIAGNDPSYRLALQLTGALPAFVSASIDRGVSGCFQSDLDASGNVVVTSLIAGWSAPSVPRASTPPALQLPSTSTSE